MRLINFIQVFIKDGFNYGLFACTFTRDDEAREKREKKREKKMKKKPYFM